MITNFEEVLIQLKTHLPQYLISKGIDPTKKFLCPVHSEKTPSCHLLPDKLRIFCHGCSGMWDILDLVDKLDGKPLKGPGFIPETIKPLCDQFNIKIELAPLTEQQKLYYEARSAYKLAAQIISSEDYFSDPVLSYINEHRWPIENIRPLGVAEVKDSSLFLAKLLEAGYPREFLKEIDLDRPDMFAPGHLVFTFHDEHGNPVGFTSRNCGWKAGSDQGGKYVNQRTGGNIDVFQKGKRLYNIHVAKKLDGPTYIFEGQPNVITATLMGIPNCVAIGGTSFTEDQALLLAESGIRDIVLCLDGDQAGQTATERILDKRLASHHEIKVHVITMPPETDPDEFLRAKGLDEFNKLTRWSAFEWRLQRFLDSGEDPEQIAIQGTALIATEPSRIIQETMVRALSQATGHSMRALETEVERLTTQQSRKIQTERDLVLKRAFHEAQVDPGNAEAILSYARDQLTQISTQHNESRFSEDEVIQFIASQKEREEQKTDSYSGFILGQDLATLQEALSGEWNKDVLCIFGGKPNAGKSSLVCKLAYEIAAHEKENNAIVIYHTIDDTAEQLLPKFVCIAEGSKTGLTINDVRQPQFWLSRGHRDILSRRKAGYETVTGLVKRGRLVVKDMNHGNSLSYVESLISYYKDKYPDRALVYVLDNFHKLPDFQSGKMGDERVRFKTLSSITKGIATRHHVSFHCTMEYTKLAAGTRPGNTNISESGQMEYDANLIAHIYNDVHDIGEDLATEYHFDTIHGKKKKLPVIDLTIGKNKITDFKNRLWFKFWPASADFSAVSPDEVIVTPEPETRTPPRFVPR